MGSTPKGPQQFLRKQYGAELRGLSRASDNPFMRCPPLFEDAVRSSTQEFPVRPGTGRGDAPSALPLAEYIAARPGSTAQLSQAETVVHPPGRHTGRLGGERSWTPSTSAREQQPHDGDDDGSEDDDIHNATWWKRSTVPSIAARLRLQATQGGQEAEDDSDDALDSMGRPLTRDRANLLFRRQLHETVTGLAEDVHTSGRDIIHLLSSYLDRNWRPPELADGGTFLQGGSRPESVRTSKVPSSKRYLPYAMYAHATHMPERRATSRQRNRDAAASLASPLRGTVRGSSSARGAKRDADAAARRLERARDAATSARIAALMGSTGEDLAAWDTMAPLGPLDLGLEALELNTELPEEGSGEEPPLLDEPVSTTAIYNPYHTPLINYQLDHRVQRRVEAAEAEAAEAEAAAAKAAAGSGEPSTERTLADHLGSGAADAEQEELGAALMRGTARSTATPGNGPPRSASDMGITRLTVRSGGGSGTTHRSRSVVPQSTVGRRSKRGSPRSGAEEQKATESGDLGATPAAKRLTFDIPDGASTPPVDE